jgi:hypothetical protein
MFLGAITFASGHALQRQGGRRDKNGGPLIGFPGENGSVPKEFEELEEDRRLPKEGGDIPTEKGGASAALPGR